jgi:hypothetical protein
MRVKEVDGLKFLRQSRIEMQNNFPERPNAENSVTPFGVLEMVIFKNRSFFILGKI